MLNSYFQDVLKDLCHHESPFLSRYRRVGHNLVQGMNILMYFFSTVLWFMHDVCFAYS